MRARLMVLALALVSLSGAACSDDKKVEKMDMRPASICPSNPQFCSGTCCATACVQTDVDKNNCGGCGIACGTGAVCSKGKCGCLPSGTGDIQTDVHNCGACGHECGEGALCNAGKCTCGGVECSTSETCCNGTCSATCVQPDMASGLSPCDCSGLQDFFGTRCPLSGMCVAKDCCFENTQGNPFLMMCVATPTTCSPSPM